MTLTAPAHGADGLHRYAFPELTVGRFVGARAIRSGALWGLILGAYVFASASGFNSLGSTTAAREHVFAALADNPGLQALLGEVHLDEGVGGFVDWRALGVMSIFTAVWALLAATRALRGEEASGRWELFLAGRTTSRAAALNALGGLGAGIAVMFALTFALVALVGRKDTVGFDTGASLLFALTAIASPALFLAVGALASQLMATRGRAATLSSLVLGVAFMLRALGDAAPAAHWLVYFSPLGWIEQVRPLGSSHPQWLAPMAALIVALTLATVWLADRDLGSSTIADSDTAEPHLRLLGTANLFALRLSRSAILAWLAGMVLAGWLYGSFTASAARAFASSTLMKQFSRGLTGHAQLQGAKTFAAVIFLVLTTLVMAYAASAVGSIREQEAEGYLDNLLVRGVTRWGWLCGRAIIVLGVIVLASTVAAVAFWIGARQQHAGLGFGDLILAGLNAAAPGVLLLGIALAAFGFWPRWTAPVAYGVLAWSFLLEMLGSAISINRWVMDTSLLHHIAPAPATPPDWAVVAAYVAIALALGLAGAWRFDRRDLQSA